MQVLRRRQVGCGAVNSPVTAMVLAVELFGAEGLLFYALSCSISFVLSGYSGLYSSQTILFSKLKAQYIHVQTNGYKAGNPDNKS